jgi:hypothetical protein
MKHFNSIAGALQSHRWICRLEALFKLLQRLERLFKEDYMRAIGAPGQPGSASELRTVAAGAVEICEAFYEWELSINRLKPDAWLTAYWERLYGLTLQWVVQIDGLSEKLRGIVDQGREGTYELTLDFDAPALKNPPAQLRISVRRENPLTQLLALVGLAGLDSLNAGNVAFESSFQP